MTRQDVKQNRNRDTFSLNVCCSNFPEWDFGIFTTCEFPDENLN